MLKVMTGNIKNTSYNPPGQFSIRFKDEWLDDPFIIEIIDKIDNVEILEGHRLKHRDYGFMSPYDLSGGTQTLLLMYKDTAGIIYNASKCGENCASFILEIAKRKGDLTIMLNYDMHIPISEEYPAYFINNGETYAWIEDLIEVVLDVLYDDDDLGMDFIWHKDSNILERI